MLSTITAADALARLDEFSTLIDARSESEFALDRMPDAVNWPSLTDAERIVIGTEYVQVSPFLAKKRGAALVARNIAAHIEREVLDKPKDWRPLVYCWRGGTRSGSLSTVLDQIGFRVHRLEGGYQAYRRAVIAALDELPAPGRGRISRRVKSFPITPRVTLRPDERAQRWLLGVSASDRSGLLYSIALVLARFGVNLQLAKITTLGERVEDTFLIDGPALQQNKVQLQVETELLDALAP